jgi:hypothetical protein
MKIDLSVNEKPRERGVFCWAFDIAQAQAFCCAR